MKVFRFASLTAIVVANALYAGNASSQQQSVVASSELRTRTIVASFKGMQKPHLRTYP